MFSALARLIARWIAPYIWAEISQPLREELENYAYSVVAARACTEELAEALGYTVVMDRETNEVVVEKHN